MHTCAANPYGVPLPFQVLGRPSGRRTWMSLSSTRARDYLLDATAAIDAGPRMRRVGGHRALERFSEEQRHAALEGRTCNSPSAPRSTCSAPLASAGPSCYLSAPGLGGVEDPATAGAPTLDQVRGTRIVVFFHSGHPAISRETSRATAQYWSRFPWSLSSAIRSPLAWSPSTGRPP